MSVHLDVIPQTPRAKSRQREQQQQQQQDRSNDVQVLPGHVLSSDAPALDGKPGFDYHDRKLDSSELLDPDSFRSLTASPFSDIGRDGRVSPAHLRVLSPVPSLRYHHNSNDNGSWRTVLVWRLSKFWAKNRGVILVASSQLFGAIMNLAARLLELEGEGMHPFQILFARMSLTSLLCCAYIYWARVPHLLLGPPEVRALLLTRGLTGFFGIYGMWYSMMYLPLAEATVITFLAPCVSGYVCHVLLKDPFTRKEQIASFVALAGVVLIARPTSLFSSAGSSSSDSDETTSTVAAAAATAAATAITTAVAAITTPGVTTPSTPAQQHTLPHLGSEPTPSERLVAISVALVGVLGGAAAFTSIRWIGKRAHSLVSVNYFSACCMLVSITVLLGAPVLKIGQPDLRFALPSSARQWLLLLSLGLSGFVMQLMMTTALGRERSNRATAMVYTHMLFAAGFDKWVFGHQMGVISLLGCGLIVGSALWVALTRKETGSNEDEGWAPRADVEAAGVEMRDEGVPMLRVPNGEGDEEEETDGRVSLELASMMSDTSAAA